MNLDSGQDLAHFGQRSGAQLQGSIIIILLLADDTRDVGSICLAIRSVIGKILFVLNPAISTRASWEASTSATQADRKTKKPITNISFQPPVRLGLNLSQAMGGDQELLLSSF